VTTAAAHAAEFTAVRRSAAADPTCEAQAAFRWWWQRPPVVVLAPHGAPALVRAPLFPQRAGNAGSGRSRGRGGYGTRATVAIRRYGYVPPSRRTHCGGRASFTHPMLPSLTIVSHRRYAPCCCSDLHNHRGSTPTIKPEKRRRSTRHAWVAVPTDPINFVMWSSHRFSLVLVSRTRISAPSEPPGASGHGNRAPRTAGRSKCRVFSFRLGTGHGHNDVNITTVSGCAGCR
jgi:hypothetical protein